MPLGLAKNLSTCRLSNALLVHLYPFFTPVAFIRNFTRYFKLGLAIIPAYFTMIQIIIKFSPFYSYRIVTLGLLQFQQMSLPIRSRKQLISNFFRVSIGGVDLA